MFTVKHVHPNGHHQFWQTDCIKVRQGQNAAADYDKLVWFMALPDFLHITLDYGDVYVMNGKGATVQQYHLGDASRHGDAWEIPSVDTAGQNAVSAETAKAA